LTSAKLSNLLIPIFRDLPKKNVDAMREAIDALNDEIKEFKVEKKKKKKNKRKAGEMEEEEAHADASSSPQKKRKKSEDLNGSVDEEKVKKKKKQAEDSVRSFVQYFLFYQYLLEFYE